MQRVALSFEPLSPGSVLLLPFFSPSSFRSPAVGAPRVDCYERICGNPRSNLHADGNGCVSSPIPPVFSPPRPPSAPSLPPLRAPFTEVGNDDPFLANAAGRLTLSQGYPHLSLKGGRRYSIKLEVDLRGIDRPRGTSIA